MKTRMEMILSAALAATVCGALPASAATGTTSTNVTPAVAGTNSNPEAAMTVLFGDPVIAKGKGFEIKRSELDELLTGAKANAAAQGQMLPPAFEVQILNNLIFIHLMEQKATEADKAEGKRQADLQFTNIAKRFASEEAFERQLRAVGMTAAELRAKATQEAVAHVTLRRVLNINVTDSEAKEYYTNHPADFEQPEKAHLRHILLLTMDPATRTPLSADERQAKRKKMDELLKRARSGENFTNLVAQYSEDPASKDSGGELPPLSRDQMSPELAATAFSLTNNQVSDVIETPYGYHIVKLLSKIPANKLAFTDKTPLGDMTVADYIKEYLVRQKTAQLAPAYVDKLKKESGVEILDPSLKARAAALEAAATNNAQVVAPGK